MADIQPFPWQTDASTGEWFWVPKDHYRSSDRDHSQPDRHREQERQPIAQRDPAARMAACRRRWKVSQRDGRLDEDQSARRFSAPGPGRSMAKARPLSNQEWPAQTVSSLLRTSVSLAAEVIFMPSRWDCPRARYPFTRWPRISPGDGRATFDQLAREQRNTPLVPHRRRPRHSVASRPPL